MSATLARPGSDWDSKCLNCAPPTFDLPPPPRPPWLEELEDCSDNPTKEEILDQLESCEHNTLFFMEGGDARLEDAFHGVAVVLVCSLVLVMLVLTIGVTIYRLVYHKCLR